SPHHFTLTDEACATLDPNTKMYPPLRSAEDREAVRQGLREGVIDAIATDHAPHSDIEKNVEFERAAFGILGLQTALPLTLRLIQDGVLSPLEAIGKLTHAPAKLLGLRGGTLAVGAEANVTLLDPTTSYTFESEQIRSKSLNSPFIGWELAGRIEATIFRGKVVYDRNGKRAL
ncbi:MAG: amidohydrolase family protein, partial [Myxococcales bacterium]|nr:amidohydrolase family protein [Myxococcales bacterium]